MKLRIFGSVGLLALLAASFVYGQQWAIRTNVSHEFKVAGKELPAGQYVFSKDANGWVINIAGSDGRVLVRARILTKLAAGMHTTPKDSHLVFDKVGDTFYLSEIWLPNQDGLLLTSTKDKHEHEIVDLPR